MSSQCLHSLCDHASPPPAPPPPFTIDLCPSHRQQKIAATTALFVAATGEIGDVGVRGEGLGDLAGGLDLADLDEAVTVAGDGAGDGLGGLGLALGADDVGLALLLGLLDDEAGALGVLLGDLLLLDGTRELFAEGHVGDGDVLERDVELGRALRQVRLDPLRDGLALRD